MEDLLHDAFTEKALVGPITGMRIQSLIFQLYINTITNMFIKTA